MNKKQFLTITLLLSSVTLIAQQPQTPVSSDLQSAATAPKAKEEQKENLAKQQEEAQKKEKQRKEAEELEAKRKQEEQEAKDKAEKAKKEAEEAAQNTPKAKRERAQAEEAARRAAYVETTRSLDTVLPASEHHVLLQTAQQTEAIHDQKAEEIYTKLAELTPAQPVLSEADFEALVGKTLRNLQKELTLIPDQATRQSVLNRVIAKVEKARLAAVEGASKLGSRAVSDEGKVQFRQLIAAEKTLDALAVGLLGQKSLLVTDYQASASELAMSPTLFMKMYPTTSAFVIGVGAAAVGGVAAVLVDRQYVMGKVVDLSKQALAHALTTIGQNANPQQSLQDVANIAKQGADAGLKELIDAAVKDKAK